MRKIGFIAKVYRDRTRYNGFKLKQSRFNLVMWKKVFISAVKYTDCPDI